jgi:hypothetical protein
MLHTVTHTHQDGVLHIKATGAMNRSESVRIWEQVQSISHKHPAERILIECIPTSGRISMEHCFELIDRVPLISRCLACRIALFGQHMGDEMRELMKFVETAVTDRGAQFKLFFELEEARLWLNR